MQQNERETSKKQPKRTDRYIFVKIEEDILQLFCHHSVDGVLHGRLVHQRVNTVLDFIAQGVHAPLTEEVPDGRAVIAGEDGKATFSVSHVVLIFVDVLRKESTSVVEVVNPLEAVVPAPVDGAVTKVADVQLPGKPVRHPEPEIVQKKKKKKNRKNRK